MRHVTRAIRPDHFRGTGGMFDVQETLTVILILFEVILAFTDFIDYQSLTIAFFIM